VALLLGSGLHSSAAVTLGRLVGAALLALGVACWLARLDGQSRAAKGLVMAMLLYNLAAVAILGPAGIESGLVGVALWPAVVLHAAMAVWCIACLKRKRVTGTLSPLAKENLGNLGVGFAEMVVNRIEYQY
jgi:hypothetical protein